MINIIIGVVLSIIGIIVLLALVYLVSGIQARAWIDVFGKYLDEKLKKQ